MLPAIRGSGPSAGVPARKAGVCTPKDFAALYAALATAAAVLLTLGVLLRVIGAQGVNSPMREMQL